MSAYRDETAALRLKLENETARADEAEAKLARYELGRESRWNGDISLFIARVLLIATPLGFALLFLLYFGVGVAMLGIFDDTRAFVAFVALFVSPLFIAGPFAAWKTETPSRAGWGLALFSFLYLLLVFPPTGLYGLVVFLRGRTRDAVFGAVSPRVRVEPAGDEASEAVVEEAEEQEAETRTSRSAARPS